MPINYTNINLLFKEFEDTDIVFPRVFYANDCFNGRKNGFYLSYYIHSLDSQGYKAALKLEFFASNVRFSNFRKPDPREKYKPYFDRWTNKLSCSYEDFLEVNYSAFKMDVIASMANNWKISTEKFLKTLEFAGALLWDAEDSDWIGESDWECGEFRGILPPPKFRSEESDQDFV